MKISIALGTDHRGFYYKEFIKQHSVIAEFDISWIDLGCFNNERCDYPPFAQAVAEAILHEKATLGILLCGSGIGVAIAANRYKNIRAGTVWNIDIARAAREDDNCNIIALPADYLTQEQIIPIINAWLSATFKEGRYAERLAMIDKKKSDV